LRELDRRIDAAQEEGNLEQINLLNQDFHRALYTANPHQISMPLIESLWLQLGPFLSLASRHLKEHYVIDRHDEAMQAIESQNSHALQLAISADIREGIAFVSTPERLHHFIEECANAGRN